MVLRSNIMKSTINIEDALFFKIKELAKNKKLSFRELVEEGLLLVLKSEENQTHFQLKDGHVNGNGLTDEYKDLNWDLIRSKSYEDRG